MIRNILGSLLALIGAAAAVFSPFRPWYDGRLGRDFRLEQLFTTDGFTSAEPALFYGLFLPMAFAALVTLVAVVLRSRWLTVLAALIVLATTVLWFIQQARTSDGLYVARGEGVGDGAASAAAGGLLLLFAAVVMRGRRKARRGGRLPEEGAPARGREARHDDPYAGTDVPPTQPTLVRAPHADPPPPEERLWYGTGAVPQAGAPGQPDQPQQQPELSETERTQYIPRIGGEPWPPDPQDAPGATPAGSDGSQPEPDSEDRTQVIPRIGSSPEDNDKGNHRNAA